MKLNNFKKIGAVFILLLLVLTISACSSSSSGYPADEDNTSTWEPYSTSSFGVTYPSEWSVYQESRYISGMGTIDMYVFTSLETNTDTTFSISNIANVFEGFTEEDKDLFLEEWKSSRSSEIKSDENDEFLYNSSVTIDNQNAVEINYNEYVYGEENKRVRNITAYYKNDLYIILFSDKTSKYADTEELGDRIISSIEFLN